MGQCRIACGLRIALHDDTAVRRLSHARPDDMAAG
jgi:hypothetical protein